jgi:hypothetical protein
LKSSKKASFIAVPPRFVHCPASVEHFPQM